MGFTMFRLATIEILHDTRNSYESVVNDATITQTDGRAFPVCTACEF